MDIASLNDFKTRFTDGKPVKLPASKLVVKLRGVGFEYMVKQGKLPDPLLPLVTKQLSALLDPSGPKKPTPGLREQVTQYVTFLQDLIDSAVVEPKGLKIEWLERADIQTIVGVLYRPLDELSESSFRDDPQFVESAYDEPAIEHAPIGPDGDQGVGAGETRP